MAMEKDRRKNRNSKREPQEFEQQIIDIARVTRVMAGGKRMRFRACVVVGDKNGRVGLSMAKGADVTLAVNKAVKKAEKAVVRVNLKNGTIPHSTTYKYGAAKILLKPAPAGTGVISGGSVRLVLEAAGVKNVVSKILGTNNKINNAMATVLALKTLKPAKKKELKEKIEDNK